jgi:uncharacterized membrane protein YeaQ/YmgE (transglycosylase-associated protein family)
MLGALIGTIIMGLIIGYGGRIVLPGAQDIGLLRTLLVGVVSAVIVGLIFGSVNTILAIILGSLVAAFLLWLAIRQGWLRPAGAS